jgi:hypothetical protein
MELIHCPACNASHYQYHYSVTTAMGWTQVYKDGVLQNNNPNLSTSYCTCCECGHDFYYTEQYGKVQSIVDQGIKPEVPTLDVPINAPSAGEVLEVKAEDMLFMPSGKENTVTIPTDKDIQRLEEKIDKVSQDLQDFKDLIRIMIS